MTKKKNWKLKKVKNFLNFDWNKKTITLNIK